MAAVSVEQIVERCEAEFDRLKRARPALSSRIERAENILITHIACPAAGIIKPRVRAGELVSYLVKGSGGAVYKVDPHSFSCSCPDYHRRGKGCKHGIACYALGRTFRPGPANSVRCRRRDTAPKITRHEMVIHEMGAGEASSATVFYGPSSSYEERACSRCWRSRGFVYDGQHSEWTPCPECAGTGRSRVFIYSGKGRLLAECAGCLERFPRRELVELDEDNHDNLTYFHGDLLCEGCARAHGVL